MAACVAGVAIVLFILYIMVRPSHRKGLPPISGKHRRGEGRMVFVIIVKIFWTGILKESRIKNERCMESPFNI